MYIICLILLVQSSIGEIVLPIGDGARFTDVKANKKIAESANKYLSLKGLSQVQCVGHCTLTEDCHSVNYHGDDQICLVINESFDETDGGDSHLVHAPGWRYFKKTVVKPQVRLYIFLYKTLQSIVKFRSLEYGQIPGLKSRKVFFIFKNQ